MGIYSNLVIGPHSEAQLPAKSSLGTRLRLFIAQPGHRALQQMVSRQRPATSPLFGRTRADLLALISRIARLDLPKAGPLNPKLS